MEDDSPEALIAAALAAVNSADATLASLEMSSRKSFVGTRAPDSSEVVPAPAPTHPAATAATDAVIDQLLAELANPPPATLQQQSSEPGVTASLPPKMPSRAGKPEATHAVPDFVVASGAGEDLPPPALPQRPSADATVVVTATGAVEVAEAAAAPPALPSRVAPSVIYGEAARGEPPRPPRPAKPPSPPAAAAEEDDIPPPLPSRPSAVLRPEEAVAEGSAGSKEIEGGFEAEMSAEAPVLPAKGALVAAAAAAAAATASTPGEAVAADSGIAAASEAETVRGEVEGEVWLAGCDFEAPANEPDKLSIEEGDVLLVTIRNTGGWWFARLGERQGWVPADYLDPYPEDDYIDPEPYGETATEEGEEPPEPEGGTDIYQYTVPLNLRAPAHSNAGVTSQGDDCPMLPPKRSASVEGAVAPAELRHRGPIDEDTYVDMSDGETLSLTPGWAHKHTFANRAR